MYLFKFKYNSDQVALQECTRLVPELVADVPHGCRRRLARNKALRHLAALAHQITRLGQQSVQEHPFSDTNKQTAAAAAAAVKVNAQRSFT